MPTALAMTNIKVGSQDSLNTKNPWIFEILHMPDKTKPKPKISPYKKLDPSSALVSDECLFLISKYKYPIKLEANRIKPANLILETVVLLHYSP